MTRMWLDDERRPPDGSWSWVRTSRAAMKLLESEDVCEASLDHDLGSSHDGLSLVNWMCLTGVVPGKVTIHSRNVIRAREMALTFNDYGHDCTLSPFQAAK